MCGIVGLAGNNIRLEDKEAFSELLILSSLRGKDSTGVAAVEERWINKEKTPEFDLWKGTGDPYCLMRDQGFDVLLSGWMHKALIGHTRHATMGRVTADNAHPFAFDNIIGVHNGTIRGEQRNMKDFETDSETLYNNIQEYGVREAIEPLGYGSAYALVWFDDRDRTLNFLRNSERPLFACSLEDHNTLYWASESWMLQAILGRRNQKFKSVFMIPQDVHFSFNLFEGENWQQHIKKEEILRRVTVQSGYVPFRVETTTAETSQSRTTSSTEVTQERPTEMQLMIEAAQRNTNHKALREKLLEKQKERQKKKDEEVKTVEIKQDDLADLVKDCTAGVCESGSETSVDDEKPSWKWYKGEPVTKAEYKNLLSNGCFSCNKVVSLKTPHMHISRVSYLCETCWGDQSTRELAVELANHPQYSKTERTQVQ